MQQNSNVYTIFRRSTGRNSRTPPSEISWINGKPSCKKSRFCLQKNTRSFLKSVILSFTNGSHKKLILIVEY